MKQKICTSLHLCLLFLFSLAALAQNPGPRYEKNLEILMPVVSGQSQKPSRVEACAPRSNGNLLIGINKQLDDFELGDIPRGICGLAELTPQGDTVWVKYYQRAFQTQTEMRINFIRELPDGNFFVSGIVGEQYVISGFAWITDPSGNVLYRKNLEVQADPSNQYTYKPLHIVDIEVAPDGSIYYAGNYRDLFSGGVSYYEWTIAAYGKLSPTLEPVWTRIYGYNVSHSQANLNAGNVVGIKLHTNGNLIVVGMETNSTGNLNIAQVSPAGATVGSIRRRALYQGETPLGLVKAPSKELYLITNFSTLAIPTLGGTDIAINKFKEDGTFVWSKRIGSANSEVAKRVCFDVQSNTIVVAGQHTIGTQRNGWFAQFDTSGTALISKSFGNANQVEIFEDVCRNGSNFVLAGANSVLGGYLVQTDMQAMTTCTGITDVALSSAPITLPYNTSGVTHANVPARQGSYGTSMTTVRSQGLTNNNACFACSDQVYNINISACDSFFVAGAMQYASGVFTDTFPSQYAGCDSIIITNLTIYDEPQAAVAGPDQSVCGTSALLAADAPSAGTGTWTVIQGSGSFSNASSATAQVTGLAAGTNVLRWTVTNGSCSGSYDEVTIVTRQSTASTFTHTSCGPYTWINGVTYTSSTNTAKDTLVNAAGCDSVITLNLTVLQPSYATDVRTACESFTWINGVTYTASNNTATDTLVNAAGCDSVITLNLTIRHSTTSALNITSCDAYTLNGQTYTASGTYTQLLTNAAGCDSTLTLNLTIKNSTSSVLSATACDAYTLNGQTYTASGTYTQLLTNAAGCDSTITLNLTIKNSTASTLNITACDAYTLNGQTYTASGTYTQLLTNAVGCDSTITLNLTIKNSTASTLNITACDVYTLNGQTYTTSGTYTQLLTNAAGCDSTLTLNLTIKNRTSSTLNITACDAYTLNGQTYTASGTYTQLLTNAAGCDSTLTLNLTIKNRTSSTLNITACDVYTLNGQTYTTSGTYTQLLTNAAGCDSTLTLNLTIKNRTSSTLNATACDVYTLNGQTYTASGTYTQLLTNAAGCDSTLTLNLTIKNSTSSTLSATACESYTLNGQTYTSSGTYTQLLTNAAGCDSTLTLNLTIKNSTSSTLNITACESYTLNGQTYTASGTYTQLLTNAAGCDSTLTLNLVINHNSTSTLNATACESYTLNGQTYTSSGTYTQLLTNAAGCDSTLTLNLVINHNSASTLNATACESYTLNGQTYTSSGTYTQLLTNAAGCDSTLTLNLVINHNSTSTLSATACESYMLNGQTYTSSGTYTQLLTNAAGCDSTLTLNLVINHNSTSTLSATACESYTLNGQTYTSSGTYTQLLTNAAGCDSTLTLNLVINHNSTSTLNATACESYTLNGQTYTSSGTYTQLLTNAAGCDSTLTLNLTIKQVNTNVSQSANGIVLTASASGAQYQWMNCATGSTIDAATSQTFQAAQNGSYAVIVTQDGCTDTSACVTVSTVGLDESPGDLGLHAYPNPTDGMLNISSSFQGTAYVHIFDISGKMLQTVYMPDASAMKLDMSARLPGIYLLRVECGGHSSVIRIVRN